MGDNGMMSAAVWFVLGFGAYFLCSKMVFGRYIFAVLLSCSLAGVAIGQVTSGTTNVSPSAWMTVDFTGGSTYNGYRILDLDGHVLTDFGSYWASSFSYRVNGSTAAASIGSVVVHLTEHGSPSYVTVTSEAWSGDLYIGAGYMVGDAYAQVAYRYAAPTDVYPNYAPVVVQIGNLGHLRGGGGGEAGEAPESPDPEDIEPPEGSWMKNLGEIFIGEDGESGLVGELRATTQPSGGNPLTVDSNFAWVTSTTWTVPTTWQTAADQLMEGMDAFAPGFLDAIALPTMIGGMFDNDPKVLIMVVVRGWNDAMATFGSAMTIVKTAGTALYAWCVFRIMWAMVAWGLGMRDPDRASPVILRGLDII